MPICIRCGLLSTKIDTESLSTWLLIRRFSTDRVEPERFYGTNHNYLMDSSGKYVGLCSSCQLNKE